MQHHRAAARSPGTLRPSRTSPARRQPAAGLLPKPGIAAAAGKQQHPVFGSDDPLALAFLGDAVWTLHVRAHFLQPPKHPRLYQAAVKPFVTAEGQAQVYDRLVSGSLLQPGEAAFLAAAVSLADVRLRPRFTGSAAAGEAYRKATALEALVGHLHLHNPQRLAALMDCLLPSAAAAAGPPGVGQPTPSSPPESAAAETQQAAEAGARPLPGG